MEDKHYFVGIKFKGTDKSYYFSTDMADLKMGDLVVVETIAGYEIGTISTALMDQSAYKNNLELKPILRKPTDEDLSDYEMGLKESEKALKIAEAEIHKLGLPMHLLEANYTLDGSKVTITYTSENRVDFRELLRNLAPQLKCRIELRQIAARDKAKMIGGIAICGLPLCCSTFLDQFDGISISRAKNQMLTLNIPKLSGPCGKLICCLLYEDDAYTEAKKEFPRLGQVVHLEEGDYTIVGMNILNKMIKLSGYQDIKFMPLADVNEAIKNPKAHHSAGTPSTPSHSAPAASNNNNANYNPTPVFKNPGPSNNGSHQ
jgi:cell fate regulator YaaT (PSP1 superfamily)